ncbi:MAG: response regulator [Myxococcota bacterium]
MKPVVLVVDDEPLVRSALRRLLAPRYEVLLTANAEEALEALAQESVDVVLSDNQMPGMPGADLIREIQRRHPTVHRLLLSGSPPYDVDDMVADGIIETFLPKPWDAEQLLGVLARVAPSVDGAEMLRAERRAVVCVPVEIASPALPNGVRLTTGDLSRGGAFCQTLEPLAVGSHVSLTAVGPSGAIALDARVAHVVSPERARAAGLRAGMGLEFLAVPEDTQRQLDQWVEALVTQGPRPRSLTLIASVELKTAKVPEEDVAILGRLRRAAARLRELPYHVRLGVAADPRERNLLSAYEARMHEFDERLYPGRSDGVLFALREVRALLEEAHAALADPDRRAAYAAALRVRPSRSSGEMAAAATPRVMPDLWQAPASDVVALLESVCPTIPEDRPFAALLETARARLALERDETARALDHLRRALEIDPCARQAVQAVRRQNERRLRDDRVFVLGVAV